MATEETTTRKLRKPVWQKVADLEPAGHGYNIHVKVVECKVVVEKSTRDGSRQLKIAEAIVGDETGVVILKVRNGQIDFTQKDNYLNLRNAKVEMFQGYIRIAVDRWGKIELNTDTETMTEPKVENNVSQVEYELVEVDGA